ncbi:YaaR family protein (plasmid) [Pontibacillus sp. ALD_SL1]|uniref:YaaR family protein n=1 Tax=Pontibacillus sp. ALD_SL1 TaxID=2777185 RepID=UPI001A959524|nr:YaaR family protein [Pontibacillus sp. ALD_SL1]QST03021.1 YaaR family protein [Pontibacillus sp. ALD_SL1]
MKIEGIRQSGVPEQPFTNKGAQTQENLFTNILQKQSKPEPAHVLEGKMEEMVRSVEVLRKQLDFDLNLENLREYRAAVQQFLRHYVKENLQAGEFRMNDGKKLVIIREIDRKVNDLAEELLETNEGHLNALKEIGEIQGLLVNLYM